MNVYINMKILFLFWMSLITILNNCHNILTSFNGIEYISLYQGILITGILNLIAMPAMARIEMPPHKRRVIYGRIVFERNKLYNKYLSNIYNKTTAMELFRNYNFNSFFDMNTFAIILKNSASDESFYKCRVQDSDMNEKLRFHRFLENSMSPAQAIERIHNIYSHEDINLINLPIEKLFDEYLENDLFDTVSFDDYYAIQNFLTNEYITTNLPIPSLWRIKKAMYSLALRQYDSFFELNINRVIFCLLKTNSESVDINGTLTFNEFIVCNHFLSNIREEYESRNTTFVTIYKLNLSRDSFLALNLQNIDKTLNQYIILPDTKFKIHRWNIEYRGRIYEKVITIERVKITCCEWMSSVLNKAYLYAKLDAEYNPDIEV
ncbi:uncharacterized protein LOC122512714 [Leptopilina heterotoma]|uniref:uncharacterized protein LOC122512714 n=1 Tax=Leptopilina heterotoma TaxID=63436 RepID=UPI001CA89E32|nr:uncharacterized protein LOC122512714 [Leptopilina heterotoma]XP_043484668.1 uncharacterized protein LOC122512714 [Leptopilina heterotoma]XP_043484673.1 uncharacterized protein LOC122512714 [Leptopilina heterotoma]XP_043484684.1 uncharacterized protein LOC122512714 [Leptopilina heterotoma]XP_043484693.1 uncharacterized protein LOC122512714 [Leptopilina heterotoma]